MDPQDRLYEFGLFRIDTRERQLLRNGDPVPLPPKVYDTLLVLVENRGHIVEKEVLMKAVWPDTFVEEANLTVHISALRKVLGETVSEHQYIETVPRRGYRFVLTVTQVKNGGIEVTAEDPITTGAIIQGNGRIEAAKMESPEDESVPVPTQAFPSLTRGLSLWALGLCALLGLIGAVYYYTHAKSADDRLKIRSIAVLPFKPLVEGSRDESLEMGMCDALITRLSAINQLVVRPTSSVVRYNKLGLDSLSAGRELGVDALLDGYVQRSGDRIRVTAQLLSTADGKHLWSGQFDDNFNGIFAVEDSISRQISDALLLRLSGEEQRGIAKHYTENVEAYQLYLSGGYFQDKRTADGLNKSLDYFQQAIEKDPEYALAYAGLAESYIGLSVRADMPPRDSYQKAKTAAMRALEIDNTISEAHAALGSVKYFYDWDWSGAETECKRAIELSANDPHAHQTYAFYLLIMGRNREAITEIKLAQTLEPLSLHMNSQVARVLFFSHEYDQAIEQCRRTLEMDANFGPAHLFLARAYNQKRMYDEALTQLQKANDLLGPSAEVLAVIGYTYAVSGRRAEAQKTLKDLQGLSNQRYVSPYHIAMVYAGLGEKDETFRWLEKAYADREGRMSLLKLAPEFDGVRSDPRFADLIRRVGLSR